MLTGFLLTSFLLLTSALGVAGRRAGHGVRGQQQLEAATAAVGGAVGGGRRLLLTVTLAVDPTKRFQPGDTVQAKWRSHWSEATVVAPGYVTSKSWPSYSLQWTNDGVLGRVAAADVRKMPSDEGPRGVHEFLHLGADDNVTPGTKIGALKQKIQAKLLGVELPSCSLPAGRTLDPVRCPPPQLYRISRTGGGYGGPLQDPYTLEHYSIKDMGELRLE